MEFPVPISSYRICWNGFSTFMLSTLFLSNYLIIDSDSLIVVFYGIMVWQSISEMDLSLHIGMTCFREKRVCLVVYWVILLLILCSHYCFFWLVVFFLWWQWECTIILDPNLGYLSLKRACHQILSEVRLMLLVQGSFEADWVLMEGRY